MKQRRIGEWLREKADATGKSWAQLSLDAGQTKNWLSGVINRGVGANPEALAAFARSISISPLEAFREAGWLSPEETEGKIPPDLMAKDEYEARLLVAARLAQEPWRQSALAMLEAAVQGRNHLERGVGAA